MSKDVVTLFRPPFTSVKYQVEAGTTSPKNTWAVFKTKKVKRDDHYILLGERKDHSVTTGRLPSEYTEKEKEMIDPGEYFLGVAHSESEANQRLHRKCLQEVVRMRRLYFKNKEGVEINLDEV